MKKLGFIFAGLTALAITTVSPTPTNAAPTAGAFAPAIESDVISAAARRCWRRDNGRLTCTYVRPYWAPNGYYPAYQYGYYGYYGYSNLGPYYQPYYPQYYLPGYYYAPYRFYRAPAFYYGVW